MSNEKKNLKDMRTFSQSKKGLYIRIEAYISCRYSKIWNFVKSEEYIVPQGCCKNCFNNLYIQEFVSSNLNNELKHFISKE